MFLAIQLASVPLGDQGVYFSPLKLHLDLYTAPAFASVIIAVLNVIVVLLWYKEFHVDIYVDSHDEKVDNYRKFSFYAFFILTFGCSVISSIIN